jgi:hypothetical protein
LRNRKYKKNKEKNNFKKRKRFGGEGRRREGYRGMRSSMRAKVYKDNAKKDENNKAWKEEDEGKGERGRTGRVLEEGRNKTMEKGDSEKVD